MEYGEPLPERPMSMEEAMAYHCQALTEFEEETLAEYGDAPPTLSTTFGMLEVEVNLTPATAADSLLTGRVRVGVISNG